MTSSELRQMADKAEREGLTEAEILMVTKDIMQTYSEVQEDSARLRVEVDRMTDIYNRRFPELLARAERAEGAAGAMFMILKEYMSEDEIRIEVARIVEDASVVVTQCQ